MNIVATDAAPKAIGPYSQGITTGDFIFTAGQIGFDPATMELKGNIAEQTDRTLKNLAAILSAAGSDLAHVLKATVFLTDMGNFAAMNEVYTKHFGSHKPARSTVAVVGLPKNALVEIEVIAVRR